MRPDRRPNLARRALPALILSGTSGLLLSMLDRPGGSVDAATDPDVAATGVAVGAVTVATTPATAAATLPSTTLASTVAETAPPTVASTVAETTPATAASTVAPTVPETVASTVPAAPTCTLVDGATISTKWGPVQVEASVTSTGQICDVNALVTPSDHRKSVSINQRAVPVLNQNALSAQSANFNGVSGATITSNAYKQSLQSILDAAVTNG